MRTGCRSGAPSSASRCSARRLASVTRSSISQSRSPRFGVSLRDGWGSATRAPTWSSDSGRGRDFRRQFAGYGLTTAHIYYRRPDHPWLLQSYVWQEYDLCPKFPELQRFLEFWRKSLDGALHSVMVAHSGLIQPAELRAVDGVFRLH